jgi:rhodanese-related sulfurtransferase
MKIFIVIIFNLLSCCSYLAAQVPDSLKFQSLTPDEFQKRYLADKNAILIDVREFFEFRRTRIKNAVNIPSSGNLELAADTLDKNASLFLYCYSGTRSRKAARVFYDKGFSKLYSLDGGITLWKKEGKRVDRRRIKKS